MGMKKAGIGAILGAAILASAQVAEAAPQQNAVVIPYFSSARGMFTAITYVVDRGTTGTPNVVFSYTYKLDLTQNIDAPCQHFDSRASATRNDLNTFIVDGAAPDIKNDVFDGALSVGVSPIASAEGFVALRNNVEGGNIVAEAHIVVTPLRGVFSLRALELNIFTGDVGTTYSFIDADTLTPGQNTTVMFYPDYIADTYLYLIADTPDNQNGAGVFTARPYDLPADIEIVHNEDGNGIFNRAEVGRSAGGLNRFNCAAVVHIRDILGEAAYNWVANSGGWFSLGVPTGATANVMPYKIELAPGYGATITPLTPKTYAR